MLESDQLKFALKDLGLKFHDKIQDKAIKMLVSLSGKQWAIFDKGTTPVFDDKFLYCLKSSGANTVPDIFESRNSLSMII